MQNYIFEFLILVFSIVFYLPQKHGTGCRKYSTSSIATESVNATRYLAFIFLFLTLLVVFRDVSIGNDTGQYYSDFRHYKPWDFDNRYEVGYNILQSLSKILSSSDHAIFMTVGLISMMLFYNFIRRYSGYYFLSVIIFIFLGFWGSSLNIIRQVIACAVISFSYRYLLSRNAFKFIICMVIAASFHTTAIVFSIVWLIKSIKLSEKTLLLAIIGVMMAYTSFSALLAFTFSIDDSYEGYTDSIFGEGNRIGAIFQAVCYIGLVVFAWCIRLKVGAKKFRTAGLDLPFILSFLGAAILLMSYNMSIFGRLAQYFNIFELILIPNAVRLFRPLQQQFVTVVLFIYINIYFWVIQIYRPEWNLIFPYHTFL